MKIVRINVVEFMGGALISLVGIYLVAQGSQYGVGELARMGPGFFPVAVGLILIVLGVGVGIEGRQLDTEFPRFRVQAFIGVVGGMLAWAYLIEPFGLLPATVALVALSGLAENRYQAVSVIITAAVLSIGGTLIFITGLHLPVSIIRW